MRLAEDLTDATKDPVYDAVGMVATRPVVKPVWRLHTDNIGRYVGGSGPRWRDLLATDPPAVFIPSYRTDWLEDEDQDYIRARYVSLADDFWVAGKVLPPGGGQFEIIHPGRYRLSTLEGSDLAGTYPDGIKALTTPEQDGAFAGRLDGVSLTNQVVELTNGRHTLDCAADCQPAVVWVGPHASRPHRLPPASHRSLFVNWY